MPDGKKTNKEGRHGVKQSKDTLIILISSSGNSKNIVNAARWCCDGSLSYVTLSGFKRNNKLNRMNSNFNYWVNSTDYGIVENIHQILLHSVI